MNPELVAFNQFSSHHTTTEIAPPCRCALSEQQRAIEFAPCYASVLVAPQEQDLRALVEDLEKNIYHSFTARCQRCHKPCLITREMLSFPCISAHHVHQAMQIQRLREFDLF